MTDSNRRRKLIEVALPLDEINAACKADKDRKTGTIRNLHKWFAPMPLPAWRALLFAALVDDPADDNQRVYLLDLVKRLVENGAGLPDEETLEEAKAILAKQFPGGVPTVMDPFCGGGSTLVEAQRLGLPSFGSDLNPVPALISRTLTQVLPRVAGRMATAPEAGSDPNGAALFGVDGHRNDPFHGLREDVAYLAKQIRDRAWKRLSHLYPLGDHENPVAWLWARTARCPNPACGIETILATTWWLSKKRGNLAWIEPRVVDGRVELDVVSGLAHGEAPASPKIGDGVFACVSCRTPLDGAHLRELGARGDVGFRLTAVAVEVGGARKYRAATAVDMEAADVHSEDDAFADVPLDPDAMGVRVGGYGVSTWRQLFSGRQFLTLTSFADLIAETHDELLNRGVAREWADAVASLLTLSLGKMAQYNSTQCRWLLRPTAEAKVVSAFDRNDLPMMWDFAETSFMSESVGGWLLQVTTGLRALSYVVPNGRGAVVRQDARLVSSVPERGLVATDPPYFDAIGYADLSDYFYLWHRRALRRVFPDLYATAATPKTGELTASPSHHGGARAARDYFVSGFTEVFAGAQQSLGEGLPMLVVYASKEQKGGRGEETRWASILTAMLGADLEITGTWPIHGTGSARMRGIGSNAVAAYIVMVCRPRPATSTTCSLSEFNRALRRELGPAVRDLQAASILPVDLAQAAMGPGMQIYSRYRAVLDQAGRAVPVEQALRLINAALAEVLEEQEGELDAESRFAVRWWETYGWNAGSFGDADKTVRPLGISVDDVVRAQVVTSQGNRVQLLGNGNLDYKWVPSADVRPTAWEAVHHLAHRLIDRGGELEAARLMAVLGNLQDPAMALVYRLHDIAAKKGRTGDQERYNALINSWSELIKLAGDSSVTSEGLF
ncbi:DUF1156 domain-containing protein [Plantactinospora soyae]|uniref:DNA methylase n=1 Tax=Plantactinospora soyae TaxID=1544732 RepID=A0A927QZE3_9ACTN|nr:DUF1156 domain-containing protein [Plantactinospora soyae]MBE1487513.1 putative DNA methylase [Plantactinospora soyae]